MANSKVSARLLLLLTCVFAAPALLGGCVAMQRDLDPIRSDIAVMEKQFMELRRDTSRSKYEQPAPAGSPGVVNTLSDNRGRIEAIERRLDTLERRLGELSRTQDVLAPQPMAPEPVIIEPIMEAPPVPSMQAPAPSAPSAPAAPPAASAPSAPAAPGAMPAAEDLYNEATGAYRAGDYDSAASYYAEFLKRYPQDRLADNARYWLGETYLQKKEYNRALSEFERVFKDYPVGDKVPDAVYMMGRVYEELKQPDDARTAYTRVMDNYPYSDAAKTARERLDGLK